MSDIVFCDVETTGLEIDADIWEFAAIRRTASHVETVTVLQVSHDVRKAERLPLQFRADRDARFDRDTALHQRAAASKINTALAPCADGERVHLVGVNPAFDAAMISRLLRRNGFTDPPWHYHLLDVSALAIGFLAGSAEGQALPSMPWRSDDLSERCGVTVVDRARHTARGDAEWARDWFDAIVPKRADLTVTAS